MSDYDFDWGMYQPDYSSNQPDYSSSYSSLGDYVHPDYSAVSYFQPEYVASPSYSPVFAYPQDAGPIQYVAQDFGPLPAALMSVGSSPRQGDSTVAFPMTDMNTYLSSRGADQGSDQGPLSSLGGILNSAADLLSSPAGKLLGSLGGAALSAYGANKQNALQKKAAQKQAEMLAQRQAEAKRFNEPLRLMSTRTAVAAPEARRGESQFFTGNRLPSYFAEGGSTTERPYDRNTDKPSVLGFLKYLTVNGRMLPSDVQAKKDYEAAKAKYYNPRAMQVRNVEREAGQDVEAPPVEPVYMKADGGAIGYVRGGASGQADTVDARLSPGEYVMDADAVSSLGDGNNAAGAAKLDQMREAIRTHKRGAPANKIPPKAKSPLEYMKKKGAK